MTVLNTDFFFQSKGKIILMNFCHSSIFRQNISMKLTVGMCENVFSLLSLLFPLLFFMCSHAFAFSGGLLGEASSLFFSSFQKPSFVLGMSFFPFHTRGFSGEEILQSSFFSEGRISLVAHSSLIFPPPLLEDRGERKKYKNFF